ncbi:NFYB/HAP3 family transcription factor subunit [Methanobacterium alcaliphilum]|uniref:NFYB/HAP3 family transcription factor subunit n=1 Tax=Methanobacterium alcaliphilum TaxID=392018 RepID=UPI00200B6A1D|nr:NFYB/HAP3 family transcription factor subunit [Methanobacterium alcaliphilum]MCK9150371.1 NFYB/HAP3 family transcription factor subunit [Methanobacterium alcaliphilum]
MNDLSYKKIDIPFTPIVKIVKTHANMELSMLSNESVARTNRAAVENLQIFLDDLGHMVAAEASREAAKNGQNIIRAEDMKTAIETVICDLGLA